MTSGRRAAVLTVAALAVLAFYVSAYPVHGYRVALGSDSPVYVWWSRFAGAQGLGGLGTGPRAGILGPIAALSKITRLPEADLVAGLAPALAVVIALGAGSLVDAALEPRPGRFALAVILTGTFLSLMVPGYLSTLAFGAAFVPALAVLATALEGPGWLPIVGAGGLIAAAGLSHVLFLALAAAVLAGAMLAVLGPSRRLRAGGRAWARTPVGRVAAAAVGGAAAVAAGLAATGALAGIAGSGADRLPTARDTVLRRLHLPRLLHASYHRKLVHDFLWYRATTVAGAAVAPVVLPLARTDLSPAGRAPVRRRFLWGALAAWILVTVGAVIGLLVGFSPPGQRLAAFCVPLPILAAAGLSTRRQGRFRRATVAAVVLATVGYGAVAWMAWNEQKELASPAAVDQARRIGAVFAAQPPGAPLIVVVDNRGDKPSLFVVRALNYVRAAVPPARVADVYAFVGTPRDFLAGRPTLTGQREHDVMARAFWHEIQPLRRGAVVVAAYGFDPSGYRSTRSLLGSVSLGPGVEALPGFAGAACSPRCRAAQDSRSNPGPFPPWTPVWVAPLVLGVLMALGLAWSAALLPAGSRLTLPLAPAFGLGALSLAAVATDAAGLRLASTGGWVATGLALAGGVVLAVGMRARRLTRRSASPEGRPAAT